jgi:succinate dehydrogenase/fumarate reductase flavoprotein subunit
MKQFDFLVLGSGIAGLSFALKVAPRGRAAIATIFSYFAGIMSGMACRSNRR